MQSGTLRRSLAICLAIAVAPIFTTPVQGQDNASHRSLDRPGTGTLNLRGLQSRLELLQRLQRMAKSREDRGLPPIDFSKLAPKAKKQLNDVLSEDKQKRQQLEELLRRSMEQRRQQQQARQSQPGGGSQIAPPIGPDRPDTSSTRNLTQPARPRTPPTTGARQPPPNGRSSRPNTNQQPTQRQRGWNGPPPTTTRPRTYAPLPGDPTGGPSTNNQRPVTRRDQPTNQRRAQPENQRPVPPGTNQSQQPGQPQRSRRSEDSPNNNQGEKKEGNWIGRAAKDYLSGGKKPESQIDPRDFDQLDPELIRRIIELQKLSLIHI